MNHVNGDIEGGSADHMRSLSSHYEQIPCFRNVYLEDSWVLGVVASYRRLVLSVEFVLRPGHERYRPAAPGEQYAYLKGDLRFEGVSQLNRTDQTTKPAVDGSGEVDYGNIDSLRFGANRYELSGEFGQVELWTESPPMIDWAPNEPTVPTAGKIERGLR